MSDYDGISIALLKKLSMINLSNNLLEPVFPCTLIAKLNQLCPDWDKMALEKGWEILVSKGFAKDIPLKVTGNYGQMNNATDFLTYKGIEAASEY